MLVDPDGQYAIESASESEPVVRVWTTQRLQFGTSKTPWQERLVRELRLVLQTLPLQGAEVLRGVLVSDDLDAVDAENVLFYNVGARAFAHAPACLRFERSRNPASVTPVPLASPARFEHRYEAVRQVDGFRSWELSPLAAMSWADVPCSKVVGDRAGWHVWLSMREAAERVIEGANPLGDDEEFAMSLVIRVPPGRRVKATNAVKGIVDGVVASFQRFDPRSPRAADVAELLTDGLPAKADRLLALLTDPRGRLFSSPPFNAKGRAALNSCDDRCVAGELTVVQDPSVIALRLSGLVAHVIPKEIGPT